eukprot:617846-Amphidinium_carterae.1
MEVGRPHRQDAYLAPQFFDEVLTVVKSARYECSGTVKDGLAIYRLVAGAVPCSLGISSLAAQLHLPCHANQMDTYRTITDLDAIGLNFECKRHGVIVRSGIAEIVHFPRAVTVEKKVVSLCRWTSAPWDQPINSEPTAFSRSLG